MRLSRRSFLFGSTGLIGAGLLGSKQITTWELAIRQHRIPIPKLPSVFEGYRIGFMSDIHLGVFISEEWVRAAFETLAKEKVDTLFIGGDHINVPKDPERASHPTSPLSARQRIAAKELTEAFALLVPTTAFPDGVYAIAGNHDNWNIADGAKSIFESAGIRYLVNETTSINRGDKMIEVLGVDDYWTGIPSLPESMSKSAQHPRLLLSHNPDYISMLLKTGHAFFDLALAGHTHGGQICLPGGAPIVANVKDRRFVAGVTSISGIQVLTSCGVGIVEVPWRVNCPAEVHVITLVRA